MSVIAVEGVVDHGVVRLREEVSLPEGTKVYVIVPEPVVAAAAHIRTPRLANPEQAADFRMDVSEG